MEFTKYTKETAPGASKPILDQVEKNYGFVPNIFSVFAESPLASSAYLELNELIESKAALTPQEQQITMLAISAENGCDYCVAAHSMAGKMSKVPEDTIQAIREGNPPDDPKYAALVRFSQSMLKHRGWVPEEEKEAFLNAGYTTQHVLDVISILALKTLSNYTNHLAQPPLDDPLKEYAWTKK